MHFIGMCDIVSKGVEVSALTLGHIKDAIEDVVTSVSTKGPKSRFIEAVLVALRRPMKIEELQLPVRQRIVDYV